MPHYHGLLSKSLDLVRTDAWDYRWERRTMKGLSPSSRGDGERVLDLLLLVTGGCCRALLACARAGAARRLLRHFEVLLQSGQSL